MPLQEAMLTQRAVRRVCPTRSTTRSSCADRAGAEGAHRLQRPELGVRGRQGPDVEGGPGRPVPAGLEALRRHRPPHEQGRPVDDKVLRAVEWQVDHFEEIPVLVVACLRGSGCRCADAADRRLLVLRLDLPHRAEPALGARAMGLGASLITLPLWSTTSARRILGLPISVQPAASSPSAGPRAATARRPAARSATSSTSTASGTSPSRPEPRRRPEEVGAAGGGHSRSRGSPGVGS